MALESSLASLANEVQQFVYEDGVRVELWNDFDETGFFRYLRDVTPDGLVQGRALKWYVRRSPRAQTGFPKAGANGIKELSHLGNLPEDGETLAVGLEETFDRATIQGHELRRARENAHAFIDLITEANRDMLRVGQKIRGLLAGHGYGRVAEITSSVSIDAGETGVVELADVNNLLPRMAVDVADNTGEPKSNGIDAEIVSLDGDYGPGSVIIRNNGQGTLNIASGDTLQLPQSHNLANLAGVSYAVDDTGVYPRETPGSTNKGVDRSESQYHRLRARVIEGNSQPISFEHLDDLMLKINQNGLQAMAHGLDPEGKPYGYNYTLMMRIEFYYELAKKSRQIGRQFTIGAPVEDYGLRRQTYAGIPIMIQPQCSPSDVFLIKWDAARKHFQADMEPVNQGAPWSVMDQSDTLEARYVTDLSWVIQDVQDTGRIRNVKGAGVNNG